MKKMQREQERQLKMESRRGEEDYKKHGSNRIAWSFVNCQVQSIVNILTCTTP